MSAPRNGFMVTIGVKVRKEVDWTFSFEWEGGKLEELFEKLDQFDYALGEWSANYNKNHPQAIKERRKRFWQKEPPQI